MNLAGYEILYYDDYEHYARCVSGSDNPKILHDPRGFGSKIVYGKIKQSIEENWSFEFTLPYKHPYYWDIRFIVGLVEVLNIRDDEREFLGRILAPTGEMSSSGHFSQIYICEDLRGYLHDSAQVFKKYKNDGARRFLADVIDVHNQQTEPHKRFWVRKVTVDSGSDVPYRYTAYDSTFETIKTYMLDRMGGYLTLEVTPSGMYLDWLSEIGEHVDSPIQLGRNIKSAKRELDPDGLITRLVPVGADKDNSTGREEETGQYVTRERVTIESVNGGLIYLEDTALVEEFGIIQKSVDWTEISDPGILKSRGQQYLDNQKLALASWSLETVELYLIDSRFKKYKVGNTHPIDNPPLAGAEQLQIIEKEIDILKPQSVTLRIGSKGQSLSMYQLQQQEAKKSMQRQAENEAAARRKVEAQLEATQKELEKAQAELKTRIEAVGRESNKSSLRASLSQYEGLMASEVASLATLREERGKHAGRPEMTSLIDLQITTSETRIANYRMLIDEINAKLIILEDKDA